MCSPEAAAITGGIMQGTGGFIGARGQAASLESQARIAENNAVMLDIQADDAATRGAQEASEVRQATSTAVASQVARTAGSGVDIGGATAREVFESTARTGVSDELETRRNTRKQVWALKTGARSQRETGRALEKKAKLTEGVAPIAFLGPVLTGFGQSALLKRRSEVT